MRFFTSSLFAIAALASAVFALENPISKPDGSVSLVAGESVVITWTPSTSGPITIKLRQGPSGDLKDVSTVVSGAPNSGSITWPIPSSMPSGDNYAFQISDDNTNDLNFTPLLTIKSDVGPKSSSASSATSSSTASGSTSSSSTSSSSSSSSSSATTTSKPETTHKSGHNNSTMVTSTTAPSNGTTTSTGGYPDSTTTRGGNNTIKATSSGPSSGPSSTGSSSAPSTTAPSSGAVALVMNSPLALVVCVLGAVMYLN